jgi:tetratricopeptide (TPR) repeat protein
MPPAALLNDIQARIDDGDVFLNTDAFAQAVERYQQALSMIPEPKHLYDISLPAFTALGEAYFYSGDYRNALSAFREALKVPGGVENPLLHLRLGQTYYESGDLNRAADSLTRAYALGGRDVFEGEDDKYLSFLASRIEL